MNRRARFAAAVVFCHGCEGIQGAVGVLCSGPVGIVGSINGVIGAGGPGGCGTRTCANFERARADGLDHKGRDRAVYVRFVALIFQVGQGDGCLCIFIDGAKNGSEGRQCWHIVDGGNIDRDGVGRCAVGCAIIDRESEGIIRRAIGMGDRYKF